MSWRPAPPLWLLVAGCFEEQRPFTVPANPAVEPVVARSLNRVQRAPATEETAKRVISVGQKIVTSNPQLGLRPAFCTAGTPDPEIFHRGTGGLEGCQIVITEGLVRRCPTEGQLAAVLCLELGKIIAEREAQMGSLRPQDRRLPPDAPIGNDAGGAFGSPDGTRLMEQAKLEKQQRKSSVPLSPEVLARNYMTRAGFPASELAAVQTVLHEAEGNFKVEKSFGTLANSPAAATPPAAPAKPASPLAIQETDQPVIHVK